MAKTVEYREEHLPDDLKSWYWGRLVRITFCFFLLWTVIAVWWHIPAPHNWRNVLLFGNMPLHWYLAAFISMWAGVALIVVYHAIMSRVERRLGERALEEWERLPADVRIALGATGHLPTAGRDS
jgi:putative solute:sodium symporter small subunit